MIKLKRRILGYEVCSDGFQLLVGVAVPPGGHVGDDHLLEHFRLFYYIYILKDFINNIMNVKRFKIPVKNTPDHLSIIYIISYINHYS